MTIATILKGRDGSIFSVEAGDSVRDVVSRLAEHKIGAMPVMEGDRVAGIISERDIIYCLHRDGAATLDKSVAEVMTSPAITVTSDTTVLGALSQMTRRRIRHFPVVDSDKMLGFVSIGDLVKYRMDKIESEAAAMRDYIQAV